jgi:hypothetical protein
VAEGESTAPSAASTASADNVLYPCIA